MRNLKPLASALAIVATSCASSRLDLAIDVYTGDTACFDVMPQADLLLAEGSVRKIAADAQTFALRYSEAAYNASAAFPAQFTPTKLTGDSIDPTLGATLKALEEYRSWQEKACGAAKSSGGQPAGMAIRTALADGFRRIDDAIQDLQSKADTDKARIEKVLANRLAALAQAAKDYQPSEPDIALLRGVNLTPVQVGTAAKTSAAAEPLVAAALGAFGFPEPIVVDPQAKRTFERISNQHLTNIEQLQDASDPIWKEIGKSENDAFWSTSLPETHFFAEGNSSVIVVRDTPMSFRVQRGSNNPAALVAGQLQVSRALTRAALTVASAASGTPIPLAGGGVPAATAEHADSEALARRTAEVQGQETVRRTVLRALRANLNHYRAELAVVDPKVPSADPRLADVVKRVSAALEAAAAGLESQPDPAKKGEEPPAGTGK
jgi:hypothetical protein